MVNPGGPSKGCHDCRRLRVKCDEGKPGCVRCFDAGRKCSGYRDIFVGFSKRPYKRRKSAAKTSSLSPRSIARSTCPETLHGTKRLNSPRTSNNKPLNNGFKQNSTLQEFISLMATATATSYATTMLGNRHYQDSFRAIQNSSKNHKSSLDLAISAVSNIFLSFLSRRPELEELGEEQFAVAVSLTRAALDDPTKITSDSTLISILLLSVFENFRSVMAYRSPVIMHYIGLAQILRARGPDYCNTEISQLCLQQVSGRLVDAVLGGSFIETNQLLEASRLLPKPVPDIEESPIVLLSSFVPHINQLRLKMESVSLGIGFDAESVADILSFALETESELSKWPEMVNPTCQPMLSASLLSEFQSKCPHHPAETYYPQWADEYPSLIISQIWNSYRCLRIMVNTFISRCAALTRNYSLATSTEQICQEMVDNFCASVPFHIGSLSSRHASHPGNVQGNTSASKLAALGAMLLMPKLRWIVGQHLTLRGGQMEWLQLQLSDVLQFYRMHGVRMSDDVASRASPILAQ